MREILEEVRAWLDEGRSVALVTIVATWGSAPRPAGGKMAVAEDGAMAGSVSGGCVEAATVHEALDVLRTGTPKTLHFGVADETAWDVGLACGGEIELFVEPLGPLLVPSPGQASSAYQAWETALSGEKAVVRAVVVRSESVPIGTSLFVDSEGNRWGGWAGPLADRVAEDARLRLAQPLTSLQAYSSAGGEVRVFLDPQLPPPHLVIVGGVHIAIALAHLANRIGFRVTVVEPRQAFATERRFAHADQLLREWPDEALRAIRLTPSSAVAILSHDPKLDDPALQVALASPAFYVGALGSRRTQELRRQRLRAAGLTAEQVDRLRGPIGLDLGGRSPEEIALAILAEIVAVLYAGSG